MTAGDLSRATGGGRHWAAGRRFQVILTTVLCWW